MAPGWPGTGTINTRVDDGPCLPYQGPYQGRTPAAHSIAGTGTGTQEPPWSRITRKLTELDRVSHCIAWSSSFGKFSVDHIF